MKCHECGEDMDMVIEGHPAGTCWSTGALDVYVCVPCGVATEASNGDFQGYNEMTREDSREYLEYALND